MNPQTQAERHKTDDHDLDNKASFAETALKLGGKSDDEARRTGAIDKADDQVEHLFAKRFQTVNSPVHRAVWDRELPIDLFASKPPVTPPEVDRVMKDSLEVMQKHVKAGTNLDQCRSDAVDQSQAMPKRLSVSREIPEIDFECMISMG